VKSKDRLTRCRKQWYKMNNKNKQRREAVASVIDVSENRRLVQAGTRSDANYTPELLAPNPCIRKGKTAVGRYPSERNMLRAYSI